MNRREFIRTAGLSIAGAPFWMGLLPENLWGKIPSGIKITGLKTFLVDSMVFVKIYTNKGVEGLGEGSIGGQSLSVEARIRDLERILIGRDPTNIEFLWQAMYRWPRARGGASANSAISAIDIALWDILGKVLDAPVYKLLGGAARDKVRLYGHAYAKTPELMKESVHKLKEEGFTVVRTGLAFTSFDVIKRPWNLKLAAAFIEAMREAAGDNVDILDDAHGLMTPTMALEYANAIEQYRLMFLEDPVQPENLDGLEWVGSHTNVPIAIGESNYTKFGFKDIIHRNLARYVRPDVIHAGGITECSKIAVMADAQFIDLTLHVAPSPVSNFASVHVSASSPNGVLQENTGRQGRRAAWTADLFYGEDISIIDGYAALPEKPGLGCELDEKVAAAHPYRPGDPPHMLYEDGSVSDW